MQDRLRARADDIADLLADEDAYLYVCGHKRMEAGVTEALADICAGHGLDWSDLCEKMRLDGRLHVETYH